MPKALAQNYFSDTNYNITVRRVDDTNPGRDEHDLTEQKHSHDFSELVIVTEGHGIHWVEGDEFPVTAGDAFLFQGNQEHFFKKRDGLIIYNVMFRPEELNLPLNELRKLPGYHAIFVLEPNYRQKHQFESKLHLTRTDLAKVESMLSSMTDEISNKVPGFESALYSKLIDLIVYLSRQYSKMETGTRGKSLQRVTEVIGKLEQNYQRQWKLSELAKVAKMSEGNLMRIFKEATGQSPIDFLLHLRIQRALEFLSSTDHQVTEIAYDVGFNDSNYFTRHFKKITGQTPRQYRQNN